MAKEFPIRILVEEIALGTVLRKLHDMPGVVKLDLDFGPGGQGPGRAKLEQAAAETSASPEDAILGALQKGPLRSSDLIKATGLKPHRVYYAINKLGLKKNADGAYEFASWKTGLKPAPEIERGPSGRAAPGSGPAVLHTALAAVDRPLPRSELRSILKGHGMSEKSVSGVLDRAKRDGMVKVTKDGYALTAKALNGAAHG